jgi:hypothetical protein
VVVLVLRVLLEVLGVLLQTMLQALLCLAARVLQMDTTEQQTALI